LDRTGGKNKVMGLVDVMDVCSFVTNQYFQKLNSDGWDLNHFKFIIEASLNNHSSADLISMIPYFYLRIECCCVKFSNV
jgi:hypothetical protein